MTQTELRRFDRTQTTMFFDPGAQPLAELRDGERVVVETADSICGIAKREAPKGFHVDEIVERLGGACPVTGPFYVEGAHAGDALTVELHRVDPFPAEGVAWTGIFRGFGALQHEPYSLAEELEPELRLVSYANGIAHLPFATGSVEVPLHPFIGTIGVAPRYEKRLSFSQSPEYLGDVDVPQITAGGVLVLPVNVEGALLALGDAHAAQGDGEINGAALEIEADVELTVRVASREGAEFVKLPQINNEDAIGSIAGYQGVSLADCTRAGYIDLVERLVRFHRFQKREAYELLGQVGRVQVGNMIDPFYSAMVSIDRRYLERS